MEKPEIYVTRSKNVMIRLELSIKHSDLWHEENVRST